MSMNAYVNNKAKRMMQGVHLLLTIWGGIASKRLAPHRFHSPPCFRRTSGPHTQFASKMVHGEGLEPPAFCM